MSVTRSNNIIIFDGRYDGRTLRRALGAMYHMVAHLNYKEVILDFSKCTHAFESGVLPTIPTIRNYISRFKVDFSLIPPKDTHANSLFINSGWDYFIDPKRFINRSSHDSKHVPVLQFRNSNDQHEAVNKLIHHFARNAELSKDHMQAIEWSLNEITDNVLNHSQSPVGGFVQSCLFTDRRVIEFLVADGGVGIPRSLSIKDPRMALERAIQEGVTRNKKTNQGNGLYGVFRIALVAGGQFNLQSYLGNMVSHEGNVSFRNETAPYPGTFVRWSISLDSKDIISRALIINGKPHSINFDYFDSISESDRDIVKINLKNEFISFGSREAGREAYLTLKNFVNWSTNQIVEVDFSDINIISSSFADEVFGRLFLELGPIVFTQRIRFSNAHGDLLGIIDRAMTRRFRQGS